jgi:hypothetical protein
VAGILAYIGLDWADERHSVHLQAADGRIEHLELEPTPARLHAWVAQLQQRFAGGTIAVALEQRKGAVIHALLMYDCFVLYPINPKALARYREAFTTSGAKADPRDSELLLDLDLVVRHRDKLRAWVPDTVESRTLQGLCEQRRKLVNQRVALTNRLTSARIAEVFAQHADHDLFGSFPGAGRLLEAERERLGHAGEPQMSETGRELWIHESCSRV